MAVKHNRPKSGRKGPGRDSTSGKAIATAKRHAEWLQKRIEGWSYRKIAEHFGVEDSTVWEAVTKELKAIRGEPAQELKELETQALDHLIEAALVELEGADELGQRLAVIEQVRKLRADRRKMLGTDAPSKLEVSKPREEKWASVRAWFASPTPELVAVLVECGWTRSTT